MTKRLRLSRLFAAAAAVAALGALGATAASARGLSTYSCPTSPTVEPFVNWGDTGDYFLGPAGSFEGTLTGWTAKGGPKIVSGNETFYVNSPTDSHSLSLPNGSSLASPSICVTTNTPDLRLFVLNKGKSSKLNINMTYTDANAKAHTVTVAQVTGGGSWSPIAPVNFLQNISSLAATNGCTWVTFTFGPADKNGTWQIDDFYVDPVKHH